MQLPRQPYVTTRTHEVFALALNLANRLGHGDATPVHVFLALLSEGRNVAVAALIDRGVALDALERDLEAQLPPAAQARPAAQQLAWTPGIEEILDRARAEAAGLGTEHFGCEHVLLGIVRDETSAPASVLARHGVGVNEIRSAVLRLYAGRPD